MARQGCALPEEHVRRIVVLLNTEMQVSDIAERMHCSRSAVVAINRRYSVRDYAGRRGTWQRVASVSNA